MFFCPTYRINPVTGNNEPYYRIKESYRDRLGRVHSIVLLSPGFIKGYSGKELNLTSKALNTLMAHKGESGTLFGDVLSEYPERVVSLAREYFSQMEAKGTIDTFQEKKRRDENSLQGRLLLKGDTLEHKEGRDLGAEWLCLQTVRKLGLDTFLLAQGWSEEKVQFALAHLITRTVYTPSELKSIRIIQENSAVADILGLERERFKKHNAYAVAPALYSLKDKLDDYLTRRTDSLFGLTNRIFLFDLTNFYFESPKRNSRKAKFGRSKELPIKLTEVRSTASGDHYLLVNSPSKALTEESMNRQYRQRFEDMLEAIRKGLSAKGGTKRYEKVCERVGRTRGKYPSVQRFYDISYVLDEKGTTVTGIDWTIKTPEKMDADIGIYFLRTDKPEMDEKTTWSYYNIIREIESTNRQLKTDLSLRAIYHQKDDTGDAHLYMGLLSYWIVNTIRYQLKEKGEKSYWTEIVRTMSTQKLVRSKAINALGEIVEMDICTQPTQAVTAIYDKLGFGHYPFRKMKICSAQT